MRSLLAPIPMSFMMEEADAKECLEVVVKKVVTRAAKRKAEAGAATAAEEARKRANGQARAAITSETSRPIPLRCAGWIQLPPCPPCLWCVLVQLQVGWRLTYLTCNG